MLSISHEYRSNDHFFLCFHPFSFSIHSFLTELMFCIGNTIDVVEIHTQAFRRKQDSFHTVLSHEPATNSYAMGRVSGTRASINDPVDPATGWTLRADGTVQEKGTGQGDNEAFDTTHSVDDDELDDEEKEQVMQMRADGIAEEIIKIKLETWRVQFGKHNKKDKKVDTMHP